MRLGWSGGATIEAVAGVEAGLWVGWRWEIDDAVAKPG